MNFDLRLVNIFTVFLDGHFITSPQMVSMNLLKKEFLLNISINYHKITKLAATHFHKKIGTINRFSSYCRELQLLHKQNPKLIYNR